MVPLYNQQRNIMSVVAASSSTTTATTPTTTPSLPFHPNSTTILNNANNKPSDRKGKARVHEAAEALLSMNATTVETTSDNSSSPPQIPRQSQIASASPSSSSLVPNHDPSSSIPIEVTPFMPHRSDDITYRLEIVQHPVRGRMCGFGDKDRRPLTPPLIVKVTLVESSTGEEIETDEADAALLVCSTDLWTADSCEEANIVVHPNFVGSTNPNSPSATSSSKSAPATAAIGTGTNGSKSENTISNGTSYINNKSLPISQYNSNVETKSSSVLASSSSSSNLMSTTPAPAQKGYAIRHATPAPTNPSSTSSSKPLSSDVSNSGYRSHVHRHPVPLTSSNASSPSTTTAAAAICHTNTNTNPSTSSSLAPSPKLSSPPPSQSSRRSLTPDTSNAETVDSPQSCTTTRNLVGGLHVNAHCLKDLDGKHGLFFIWHDLSVRTEGNFRLRVSLVDLCAPRRGKENAGLISEKFTEPFSVTSAKRFAGMIDPTPLCRVFAKQGLRIPTRKGGGKKRNHTEIDDDENENSEEDELEDTKPTTTDTSKRGKQKRTTTTTSTSKLK